MCGSVRLFSGTKFFRYRFRDFFPGPNFSDTGSETFFRYQFFPIPPKNEIFPVPGIPATGMSHSGSNSRYLPAPLFFYF